MTVPVVITMTVLLLSLQWLCYCCHYNDCYSCHYNDCVTVVIIMTVLLLSLQWLLLLSLQWLLLLSLQWLCYCCHYNDCATVVITMTVLLLSLQWLLLLSLQWLLLLSLQWLCYYCCVSTAVAAVGLSPWWLRWRVPLPAVPGTFSRRGCNSRRTGCPAEAGTRTWNTPTSASATQLNDGTWPWLSNMHFPASAGWASTRCKWTYQASPPLIRTLFHHPCADDRH